MKNKQERLRLIIAASLVISLLLAFFKFVLYKQQQAPSITADGLCIRCNIILVSADSVRADRMSLYGYKRKTSPVIDEWSREALVFDNYFATSYLTPISEGSVHTGLYPENNGLIGFRKYFTGDIKTLAQRLQEAGYQTMAQGDSHEFTIFESIKQSFSRGFDSIKIQFRLRIIGGAKKTFERGIFWNEIQQQITDAKKPFFFWIPMGTAHAPFGVAWPKKFSSPAYRGIFNYLAFHANLEVYFKRKLYELSPAHSYYIPTNEQLFSNIDSATLSPNPFRIKSWPYMVNDQDLQFINDRYDDGIAAVDTEFSKLLQILKETGHAEDTVIIFQSEHGEAIGEHGYIAHYDIFDEQVHVPLVIKSPAIRKTGRVSFFASGIDILPTLLSHLGVAYDENSLDGKNLFAHGDSWENREVYITRIPLWESVLKIKSPIGSADSIFDKFRKNDDKYPSKDYAIRTQDWKLIHRRARFVEEQYSVFRYTTGKAPVRYEWELYDLKKDPGETQAIQLREHAIGAMLKKKLLLFENKILAKSRISNSFEQLEDYR